MSFVFFAYLGPETMLPLTSVVATVVGVLLVFGRNTIGLMRRALRTVFIRSRRPRSAAGPHLIVGTKKRSTTHPKRA